MNPSIKSLFDRIGGQESLTKLLQHFYADVRQHKLIGPIFNRQIEDWPSHLEVITSFWAKLTGGPSKYSGQMPAKHLNLGLSGEHFRAWLQLWEFNCCRHLGETEAQEMIGLAHDIGQRLKSIIGVEPPPTQFGSYKRSPRSGVIFVHTAGSDTVPVPPTNDPRVEH